MAKVLSRKINGMDDPQLDMRTWKEPKRPKMDMGGVKLSPKQRRNIKNKKTYLT